MGMQQNLESISVPVGRSFGECTATSMSSRPQGIAYRTDEEPRAPDLGEMAAVGVAGVVTPTKVRAHRGRQSGPTSSAWARPAGTYARPGGATRRPGTPLGQDLRGQHRGHGLRVEGEQLTQRGGVVGSLGVAGQLLDPHGRRVQQLVHDPAYGPLTSSRWWSSRLGSRDSRRRSSAP